MLGIWDAEIVADDIGERDTETFRVALERDGACGRLLHISTGADGSYPIWVATRDEDLWQLRSPEYRSIEGDFFIRSETGRFRVGGLEDYRATMPRITSEQDIVVVEPGAYRIWAHELDDDGERMAEHVRREVGQRAYERWQGFPTGCLTSTLVLITGMFGALIWSWWAAALSIALAVAYAWSQAYRRHRDPACQRVEAAINRLEAERPRVILVLEPIEQMPPSQGGFSLDGVSIDASA